MESITYFETPKQVLWWDNDADVYRYGIAYRNEIICSCCGGVFEIDEILEFCHERIHPVIPINWVDYFSDDRCSIISNYYSQTEIAELATIYDSFVVVQKFLEAK